MIQLQWTVLKIFHSKIKSLKCFHKFLIFVKYSSFNSKSFIVSTKVYSCNNFLQFLSFLSFQFKSVHLVNHFYSQIKMSKFRLFNFKNCRKVFIHFSFNHLSVHHLSFFFQNYFTLFHLKFLYFTLISFKIPIISILFIYIQNLFDIQCKTHCFHVLAILLSCLSSYSYEQRTIWTSITDTLNFFWKWTQIFILFDLKLFYFYFIYFCILSQLNQIKMHFAVIFSNSFR